MLNENKINLLKKGWLDNLNVEMDASKQNIFKYHYSKAQ